MTALHIKLQNGQATIRIGRCGPTRHSHPLLTTPHRRFVISRRRLVLWVVSVFLLGVVPLSAGVGLPCAIDVPGGLVSFRGGGVSEPVPNIKIACTGIGDYILTVSFKTRETPLKLANRHRTGQTLAELNAWAVIDGQHRTVLSAPRTDGSLFHAVLEVATDGQDATVTIGGLGIDVSHLADGALVVGDFSIVAGAGVATGTGVPLGVVAFPSFTVENPLLKGNGIILTELQEVATVSFRKAQETDEFGGRVLSPSRETESELPDPAFGDLGPVSDDLFSPHGTRIYFRFEAERPVMLAAPHFVASNETASVGFNLVEGVDDKLAGGTIQEKAWLAGSHSEPLGFGP